MASTNGTTGAIEYTLQVDDYFDWEDAYEDDSGDEFSAEDEQAVLMHRELPEMRSIENIRRVVLVDKLVLFQKRDSINHRVCV